MKRCCRCNKYKDIDGFGLKADGAVYATCKDCRTEQKIHRQQFGRLDRRPTVKPGALDGIPYEARPHIMNVVGADNGPHERAFAAHNVWRLAKAQRNVPLCNFDEKWKPLIRIAKSLA